jgi:hypothetical protein
MKEFPDYGFITAITAHAAARNKSGIIAVRLSNGAIDDARQPLAAER